MSIVFGNGSGTSPTWGSPIPASSAYFDTSPFGGGQVDADADGNILLTDNNNDDAEVIARSATNPGYDLGGAPWVVGDDYELVGSGATAVTATGVGASSADTDPTAVAGDPSGNVLIADDENAGVDVLAVSLANPGYALPNGVTWTPGTVYALTASSGSDIAIPSAGQPASSTYLDIYRLTVDRYSNVIEADGYGYVNLLAVSATNPGYTLGVGATWTPGEMYRLAGNGTNGNPSFTGSSGPSTYEAPYNVAVDATGNIAIGDQDGPGIQVLAESATNPGFTLAAGAVWTPGNVYLLAGSVSGSPNSVPLAGASGLTGNLSVSPNEVVFDGAGNIIDADEDDVVDLLAESPTNPGWVLPTGDVWTPGDVYPIAGYQELDDASSTPQDSNTLDLGLKGLLVGAPGQMLILDSQSDTLVGTYAPAQPAVTVSPGYTILTLSWPANPASDSVVSYSYSLDGGTTWTAATPTLSGSTESQTVTSLINGTTYPVEIEAASDFGTTASLPVNGIPSAERPTSITGMAGTLTVGIAYSGTVVANGSPSPTFSVTAGALPGGLSLNLTTGVVTGTPTTAGPYSFTVTATNTAGSTTQTFTGAVTAATSVPGAPTGLVALGHNGSISVTFTPPTSTGGAPITAYQISTDRGQTWRTVATEAGADGTRTATVSGVANGTTYPVEVRATNVDGAGPASPAADARPVAPITAPGAPNHVTTVGRNQKIAVTFTPPASDGGAPIRSYQFSTNGGRTWHTIATSPGTGARRTATLAGVENGVTYQVKVRATNSVDHGPASDSKNVIPNAPPIGTVRRPPASDVAIPSHPQLYNGPQVYTRALDTSHNGTWAHPIDTLGARQLTVGEAATLSNSGLFRFNSAVLTAAGRADVKSLAAHLRLAHAVSCEGYTDYAGEASHELSLSGARAQAVCEALVQDGAHVTFVTHGYGGDRPVVIGGTATSRAGNRRVVVLVTR